MKGGRSGNLHLGCLLALALLAACWHAQEQAFVNVPQSTISSSRLSGRPMSMKADYTVARSNSVQYIALCATALGAAVLLRRRSVHPRIQKPRVVVQAFRMDQAPLPEMISRRHEAPMQPQAAVAVTRSDLIDCLDTPKTYSMADQDTVAAAATAPLVEQAENLGEAAPRRNGREGGRQRRERRQVGAKLMAHDPVQLIPLSFEPSKVPFQLQQAKQMGATPKNMSSREVKVRVEAPGLSASQDIGLKSFTRKRAKDA
mmetsp:Transcript_52965/g.64904  ORF Transcript_52965/g.64904 Transcript_52965/m.64904 type:complete len:258 (-) Transcript_52965:261-1034(-)